MTPARDTIMTVLSAIVAPDGVSIVARDMVRALDIAADGSVRFVIEAPSPAAARALEDVRRAAETAVRGVAGVTSVAAVLTAHEPPPELKIGRHPTAQAAPQRIPGVERVIAIASGKGGVGKSTVASNLAVALTRAGRRVGLLDADIHGPSQPRMMGVSARPASPDGKTILPLVAHGVTMMSIGLMLKDDEPVIWRGPMLMGALQQLIGQVAWGTLDVLIVDLPPGTGDVQLSLCQKTELTGAIIVSTPQDVALLDAKKALGMFATLKTKVIGMIENMSTFICPNCGHETQIFGHGGVEAEAQALGLPFLGALPLGIEVRLAGDAGTPVAAGTGPQADAYASIAARLIEDRFA